MGRDRHSRTVGAEAAAAGWGTRWGAKEVMRTEAGSRAHLWTRMEGGRGCRGLWGDTDDRGGRAGEDGGRGTEGMGAVHAMAAKYGMGRAYYGR